MSPVPANSSGIGDGSENDARLLGRAIKENWAGVEWWNLDQTEKELDQEIRERKGLTADSLVRKTILRDLNSDDPNIRQRAVANANRMKGLNLRGQLAMIPRVAADESLPVQVNVQVNNNSEPKPDTGVVIIQREDFFKNRAHGRQAATRIAEAPGPSVADSGVDSEIQDADLRPPVG